MIALLPDVNVEGHLDAIVDVWLSEDWCEIWTALGYKLETFATIGISRNADDVLVWQICQSREPILVTGNRNQRGQNSLESAIRTLNTFDSLPVITLADPERMVREHPYLERVAERMLEHLLDIESYRGVGRLYVP